MNINKNIVLLSIMCVGILSIHAQDLRKTEEEIAIEDKFVAAKLLDVVGKKDEAIKVLDTLRKKYPSLAMIHFELAKLHFEKRDFPQCELSISNAIKIEPNNIHLRYFEVEYYKNTGNYPKALHSLQLLTKLEPQSPKPHDEIIHIHISSNDYKAALQSAELKEKSLGTNEKTTLQKVEILDKLKRWKESVKLLESLAIKYPKEKKYLWSIVDLYKSNDALFQSETYLQRILAIDPNDYDAKISLALINSPKSGDEERLLLLRPLMEQQDVSIDTKLAQLMPFVQQQAKDNTTSIEKSLQDIGQLLVNIHPKEAKAHALYADILKNSGNFDSAILQYLKTLQLHKSNYLVWEQLMYSYDIVGNYEQLGQIANECIDYFPNNPMAFIFLAKAKIKNTDFRSASALLEEAIFISGDEPNIVSRVKTMYAMIAVHNKDFSKADQLISEALSLSNDTNYDAWEIKGDIALIKNDKPNAFKHWKKSAELGNMSMALKNKLKQQ